MAKTVADVFAEFKENAIRRRHIYESACEKDPTLAEVRAQIRELGAQKLMELAAGGNTQQVDEALALLDVRERELLAKVWEPRYDCTVCNDTGFVDGGYCGCILRQIYADCYDAVKIDTLPAFERFDLQLFDDSTTLPMGKTQRALMELYLGRAREYIQNFPNTMRKNILMTGKSGLGKSFLMGCMARAAREQGIDVLYLRANELFRVFFAHRMGEEVDLSYLHRAALLFVDDLGTEPVTQNVSIEYLYDLIAKRLERGKNSVFATNVDNLQARYDDRIASRLKSRQDSMGFYFDGKDLRVN